MLTVTSRSSSRRAATSCRVHRTRFLFPSAAVVYSSCTAMWSMRVDVHPFRSQSHAGDKCFSWALPGFP